MDGNVVLAPIASPRRSLNDPDTVLLQTQGVGNLALGKVRTLSACGHDDSPFLINIADACLRLQIGVLGEMSRIRLPDRDFRVFKASRHIPRGDLSFRADIPRRVEERRRLLHSLPRLENGAKRSIMNP